MRAIYGIDLGTTFTKCAVYDLEEGRVVTFPLDFDRVEPSRRTETLRSVVAVGEDRGEKAAWAGTAAYTRFAGHDAERDPPFTRFEETKLWIGEDPSVGSGARPPWPFAPHDWEYRPEDVAALVLRKAKREVEAQGGPPMTAVVVTHPQLFPETRRQATRDACALAGLELVDTLSEPDAAAIAYARQLEPGLYMVFDLGGGTLDIVLTEIDGRRSRVRKSEGLRTGGRDWDRAIYLEMVRRYRDFADGFEESLLDQRTREAWMGAAERVKLALNHPQPAVRRERVEERIGCDNEVFAGGPAFAFRMSRQDFEDSTAAEQQACLDCAEHALRQLDKSWTDLGGVVLVGGSTYLLALREELGRRVGRPLLCSIDPSTVVARGAALHAFRLSVWEAAKRDRGLVGRLVAECRAAVKAEMECVLEVGVTGSVPGYSGALRRGLGLLVWDGQRNVVVNLLPKDTFVPCRVERRFRTTAPNQDVLVLEFYQGEDSDPDCCDLIGKCVLRGLPPGPGGSPVEVAIRMEENQRIHVLARLGGKEVEQPIDWDPNRVLPRGEILGRRQFLETIRIS